MSDPLSIAASVAGIVSLSAAVFQQVAKFAKEAKHAEKNVKELASQTRNLSGVLQNLALLASSLEDQESATTFRAHHLYACSNTLYKVEERLKKAHDDFHSGNKATAVLRSLKWPFSADETKSLSAEMATHRSTLELALSAETLDKLLQCLASQDEIKAGLSLLSRKVDRINEIQSRVKMDDRRRKVIDFFLKVNPQPNFQTAVRLQQPLTGLWLTESNQTYLKWRDIPSSSLWLSGIPGAGKTVLCGVVVDEVLQLSNDSTAVAFHFCDYKNQDSQKLVNILCSIAVQLSQQNGEAFSLLEDQFALLNPSGRLSQEPEVEMLADLILKLSSFYGRVFLIVDGVDECGVGMGEVAAELRQLSEVCRTLSLAIFSRNEQEIKEELESFAQIEIAAHTKDIDLYVCAEMGKRRQLKKMRLQYPDLAEEIREKLVNGAQGMFRWVACQLDHLCELTTNRARRDALSSLPPTLPETYHRILLRIFQAGPEVTKVVGKSLHWICLHKGLSLDRLRHAVSLPESISSTFSNDDLVDADRIVEECRSFVRKRRSSDEDITADYIEFAHFTVVEYLMSIDPNSDVGIFRLEDETALIELSMTCLRSIITTKPQFKNTNMGLIELAKYITGAFLANPYYYYSIRMLFTATFNTETELEIVWTHIEDSVLFEPWRALFGPEKSPSFVALAFGALLGAITDGPALSVLHILDDGAPDEERVSEHMLQILSVVVSPTFTPLKFAASLGLPRLWSALFQEAICGLSRTIQSNLCCALTGPQIFIPKERVQRTPKFVPRIPILGCFPDLECRELRQKTVKRILKLNPTYGNTTETDIPEWPQPGWMSPLSSAITSRQQSVVEALLQIGLILSPKQKNHIIDIFKRPVADLDKILRLLVENQFPVLSSLGIERSGIKRPKEVETTGESAWEGVLPPSVFLLARAISSNDSNLCKRLFAAGVSVDANLLVCATCPKRPLFFAIEKCGNSWSRFPGTETLDFIIEHATLDDSECGNHVLGLRNAVLLAICHPVPAKSLSRMLDASLRHGLLLLDLDLNPFHVAALANNLSALHSVRAHVERNFPAYRKLYGQFLWVKKASCEDFLASFASRISRYSTSMNLEWPLEAKYSGSPLHYAIGRKTQETVDFLIDCGADLNVLGDFKRTPLMLAVIDQNVLAVESLLVAGADTHVCDTEGRTAFSWACEIGNLEILELLMPKELDLTYSQYGFTAFHDVQFSASKAPELFAHLWKKRLDYSYRPNPKQPSAVTFAFIRGGIKMKTLVLNSGLLLKVNVGDPGNPLSDAVNSGSWRLLKGVLRLFTLADMIKRYLNRGVYPGHTPLCVAAAKDNAECIAELLTHGANIDYECCFKGSPLISATTFGRLEATRELVRNGASIAYVNSEGICRNAFEAGKRHSHIRKWFLVGRYQDQDKLEAEPHWGKNHSLVKEWSGITKVEWRLTGANLRRHDESRFDYLCRIQEVRKVVRGQVMVRDTAAFPPGAGSA